AVDARLAQASDPARGLPLRGHRPRPAREGNEAMRMARALALAAALVPAAAPAAAQKKVLRVAFPAGEAGFDPVRAYDRYSVGICENIFEPLLTYDYLARPMKLVPLVAESIPAPEEGGTLYTFRIRPGIYFADDVSFKGQKRELVAKDVEYAIKRFRDYRKIGRASCRERV